MVAMHGESTRHGRLCWEFGMDAACRVRSTDSPVSSGFRVPESPNLCKIIAFRAVC